MNDVPRKVLPRLDESLLTHVLPFAALDDRQIRGILDQATSRRYDAGVAVFHEGMPAERFYMLLDGYVRVTRMSATGDQVTLNAEFIALYERLMSELSDDEAVYFADAVHPEYQTKPAFGWVKTGSNPAVKTTAGRGRVNIHGALNLETFDAPFVEPDTVDGASATQLLAKIEARNPDKRVIHVIWDNAAYHKGPDVRAFLARPECRIHLIQLPPYCPHLNPIERLWAVMHQHVTYNRHYPTRKQFADAILAFFRETVPRIHPQW
ncbi:MAG: IS630 family transposase [Roseovarius sp.]|nr:IS630 family transposase [Roseovarius sp.]